MRPVNEKPSFEMISTVSERPLPKIVITKDAMRWIEAIVDIHPEEVGWYGVVDKKEDGSYLVRDILYPKHSAMEAATCEISPEGEADMLNLLFDEGREDDIPKAKVFWGHSHHNMSTNPSPQDETQAMSIMRENQNLCIRAICNKRGEMNITVFDYAQSVKFKNVPFFVEKDSEEISRKRLENIKAIMDGDLPDKEKSDAIKIAVNEDLEKDETSKVIKWVKDLKKVNTPKKTHITPYYSNRAHVNQHFKKGGSAQKNLFPKTSGKRDTESSFEEDIDDVLDEFSEYRHQGRFY